ncbi:MAG: MOSC domain-containing protein [Ilumatobacteraceae bacterium]
MAHSLNGTVTSLHCDGEHNFVKPSVDDAVFLAGIGIQGDAHSGPTTQHLSRQKKDPDRPNLRQVHLVASEIHEGLRAEGFDVPYGGFGENVTTSGLDLGDLPVGSTLRLGDEVVIVLTGFRDPCAQIDRFQEGLRAAVSFKPERGPQLFRNGVMAVVIRGGTVRVGDSIDVSLPPEPHQPMEKV